MEGTQQEGRAADPVGERRAIEFDPLAGIDLSLAIQGQMIGIFGHQDLGNQGLGGQATLDQAGRRRSLNNRLLARPAGIFGPANQHHPELRWNDIEPLAHILADPMQRMPAAWAGLVVEIDNHLDTRQMAGRDPRLVRRLAGPSAGADRSVPASMPASTCSTSSSPSSNWSSGNVSARLPKR